MDVTIDNLVITGSTSWDYSIEAGSYFKGVIKNSNGLTTKLHTTITGMMEGTSINYVNYADVANADFVETPHGDFTRCGTGQTDQTAHTTGTGNYSLRLEPKYLNNPLEFKFKIPTGDIISKDMTLSVWVKINSTAYYGGTTYRLPRLSVSYDDGASTAYAQATATTAWQLLSVTFTPTTTFGEIDVSLNADTDATSTNAYVYFDDFTTFFPAGVALNLGGLDNWSNALPVVPPISTSVNAADVWNVLQASVVAPRTMGKTILDILNELRRK